MQPLARRRHRRRREQRRPDDRHPYRQLPGAGGDLAEGERRFGEAERGAPQGGGSGGGDPVVAGGHPGQSGAGLSGPVQVGAGRGRGHVGDHGHPVAAGLADLREVRLAARPEHPVADGRITFAQVVDGLVDAGVAVPVAVGGAAADGVGEQAGEGGWFRAGSRGDHHPAAAAGGARGAEIRAGVDRAAGAPVQDDQDLAGLAAVHQRVDPGHVDGGVGRALHDGVRGGQVEATAGAGEQDAAEVDQQAVLTRAPVAERLQALIGAPGVRVLEELHIEPAQRRIAQDGGERPHVRGRHRIPAQDGIVVVFDRHHNRQPSPTHRITLGPSCDLQGRAGTPGRLRTVPTR
ncbi:hypothetical protein [Actinoplanes awajinensis]|uniref:hypothetical protein n=1 Tax=Actinoplanes awajinensis TaxID=135946 RepID=UPI0012F97D46|nr:hypothetical protein [Actinoplanes awajinensis]